MRGPLRGRKVNLASGAKRVELTHPLLPPRVKLFLRHNPPGVRPGPQGQNFYGEEVDSGPCCRGSLELGGGHRRGASPGVR